MTTVSAACPEEHDSCGGDLTYGYDDNGNRTTIGYPGGVEATYDYDFADRAVSLSVTTPAVPTPATSVVGAATYLPGGPLATLAFGNGLTETRTFDERYGPQSIALDDSRNRLWTYDTDGVGNITQIDATADCSGGITLSQDVTGPEEHESCAAIEVGPDVTVTSSGSLDLTAATQVVLKTGFAVAAGGSLAVAVDPALSGDVTKDYTHKDYDYFLKAADGPWGNQSWTYDKIGNRTSETDNGWTDTYSYVPNASASGNTARLDEIQLWLGGMRNFSYSPAGHQTQVTSSGNTVTFDYDDAGRLKEASRTGGASSPFLYDGRGFLRQAGTLSTTTGTVVPTYDSSGLLHTLLKQESSTDPQRRYHVFYLADRPVAQLATETGQPDRWWYLTTDHLGTPILATDTNGSELWASRFEPFGGDPTGQALANEMYLRFPGQWEDGTWEEATKGAALSYNVHRWNSPATGRYNRPDPLGLRGSSALMVYGYAEANPLHFYDSFGLCSCKDDCPSGDWIYTGVSAGGAFVGGIAGGIGFFQCEGKPSVEQKVKSVCAVIGLAAWAGVDLTTGIGPGGKGCNREDLLGLHDGWFGGLGPLSANSNGESGTLGISFSAKLGGGWIRCRVNPKE